MKKLRSKKLAQMLRPDKLVTKCVTFERREGFGADEYNIDGSDLNLPHNFQETCGSTRKLLKQALSEINREKYMTTQELRLSVGTWNVAGKSPPSDLLLDEWLDVSNPADIYVIGFQEVVPLNAGNIVLGSTEDSRPAARWENLIRRTLIQGSTRKQALRRHRLSNRKCLTAPSSPWNPASSCQTSPDHHPFSDPDREIRTPEIITVNDDDPANSHPRLSTESVITPSDQSQASCSSSRSSLSIDSNHNYLKHRLKRTYSGSHQLGLKWSIERTESQPANWLATLISSDGDPGNYSTLIMTDKVEPSIGSKINPKSQNSVARKKQRLLDEYVRVASKQMVGIHVSVWMRRRFSRHIRSIRVSTVGIGLMGYFGNKGAVSVSLALHQTTFCFVCTHLSHGGKEGDESKRNADVLELFKRTRFPTSTTELEGGLPKTIDEHDRVIMLGDLNYRLNLSDGEARALVEQKQWQRLLEDDQLKRELSEGKTLEGWREGSIDFAPTYKYEMDSDEYTVSGENPRTPAWCDRILWRGKGLKNISYTRGHLRLSDHRPVNATFAVDIEVRH